MNTFVKIFKGYTNDIENDINKMVRERNLNIVSISSCINQVNFFVTVVFKKKVEGTKTEVEELREINSLLSAAVLAWQKHYENLAREIFEEIEEKVKASITVHLEELNKEHIQDTPLYDRHSGIIFALRVMDDFIAEIRKKYTEENKYEN